MSMRTKLTCLFLLVAILPVLTESIYTFFRFRESVEESRITQMRDLGNARADRIENHFNVLKNRMAISQGFYNIKQNLPILSRLSSDTSHPASIEAKKKLDGQLFQMVAASNLSDIMLADTTGRIAYAVRPSHIGKNLPDGPEVEKEAFIQGKKGIFLSKIVFDRTEDRRFEILVTAPATDFQGRFIGVIVFEVDMTPIYELIQDVTGLGETGEVLIGKRMGGEAVFLNPLRHDTAAALRRRVPLGAPIAFPLQEAVQGEMGVGHSIDYRGVKVLAAWRYLPVFGVGMVVKIDEEEAYADLRQLEQLIIVILAVTVLLAIVLAYFFARRISDPVRSLSESAEIIGKGNLDHRIDIVRSDEIGQLARSLEKMANDLKNITASRDELNREMLAREKAEKGLRQAAENLSRSNRELEQFAYIASHDLKEPLRAVTGFLSLLEKRYGPQLDAEGKEFIATAMEGAIRMGGLIEDLLVYSRVEIVPGRFTLINMQEALGHAMANLKSSIDETGAEIAADSLPALVADPTQMTQLLQNLIGNAIKYRGSRIPRVQIGARREVKGWTIEVRDNGIGIEPQYFERIFAPFTRLHTRAEYPGSGIGLAVCKKIVEGHGGKIGVESTPGEGSIFHFTIPDRREGK